MERLSREAGAAGNLGRNLDGPASKTYSHLVEEGTLIMTWPEQLLRDRGELLSPADPGVIEEVARSLGIHFPQEYVEFLLWADGGILPGKRFLLYSVGPGLHPAETILAANRDRPADFPLLLIGRDAFEEFGFLKAELVAPKPTSPLYLWLHETEATKQLASSFSAFIRSIVTKD